MTPWDFLAAGLALALVLEGVFRGAVRLAFGLAGIIAGYLLAGRMAGPLAGAFTFLPAPFRPLAAGAACFGATVVAAVLAGYIVHRLVKAVGLSLPNRFLGAVLGMAVACALAGGLAHFAKGRAKLASELGRSPIFSALARGGLLIEGIMGEADLLRVPASQAGPGGDRA